MTTDEISHGIVDKPPQIDGFEIISIAGRGGMSVVYKARQIKLNRIVAVKLLHKHLISDGITLQRFVNEGRIATTLHHPNLASVFSCGTTQDEQPYLVLEFLSGDSLKDVISGSHGLPPEHVRDLFSQILAGLKAAHDAGIIHRDLKPGNVMMEVDESNLLVPKIVDFGIAKFDVTARGEAQRLTKTGAVIGSPTHMSPEQCIGGTVDVRSDIYSFGCMMFEALTGRLPFEGDNVLEVMTQHLNTPAPTPSALTKRVPADMDEIVLKCLEKDPNNRYANCDELIAAFQNITLSQLGSGVMPVIPKLRRKRKIFTRHVVLGLFVSAVIFAVVNYSWQSIMLLYCDEAIVQAQSLIRQRQYDRAIAVLSSIQMASLPREKRAEVALTDYMLTQSLDEEAPPATTGEESNPDIAKYERGMNVLRKHGEQSLDARYLANISELIDGASNSIEADGVSTLLRGRGYHGALDKMLEEIDSEKQQPVHTAFIKAILMRANGGRCQINGKYKEAKVCYSDAVDQAHQSGLPEHELAVLMTQASFLGAVGNLPEMQAVVARGYAIAPAAAKRNNYEAVEALIYLMDNAYVANNRPAYEFSRDALKAIRQDYSLPRSMSDYISTVQSRWDSSEPVRKAGERLRKQK